MSKLSELQHYSNYVQSGLADGQFMSATFMALAAGPPRLSNIGGAAAAAGLLGGSGGDQLAWPIGLTGNFNLSQNTQIARLFEIGSDRSYFISGRTVGQIGLNRVMYHGPSLLRALYAYYQDLVPPTLVTSMLPGIAAAVTANPHNVKVPPGYANIFLNLASDMFKQPIGMLVYLRDSNEDTVGALYAEGALIPSHQLGTDAQGVVVQESAALQYERLVPVAVMGLPLIDAAATEILGFGS